MKKFGFMAMIALGGLLACGTLTHAQDAPAKKDAPPGGGDQRAAMRERMQKMETELKLTDEQKTKIGESRKALGEKMRALQQDQDLTPEAKREKMKEMRDSNQATMKTILTPEQFEKWQKMAQPMSARPGRGGPDAPAKPDAAK
jgi:Spy/CpxP family protein refolding chaperone